MEYSQNKNTNPEPERWNGLPYYSLNTWLRQLFGQKVYKLSLHAGMSCPNRDGKIGHGGCIFCSAGGSGEFAAGNAAADALTEPDIGKQIEAAKQLVSKKYHRTDFTLPIFNPLQTRMLPYPGWADCFMRQSQDPISQRCP
ncbi:hypothetical protein C823_006448 [Eubacterium plexicaudatum ASF492]|nr:hypothetical protein C823_006448 [Eubacterium plexicaudatum ASF492]